MIGWGWWEGTYCHDSGGAEGGKVYCDDRVGNGGEGIYYGWRGS